MTKAAHAKLVGMCQYPVVSIAVVSPCHMCGEKRNDVTCASVWSRNVAQVSKAEEGLQGSISRKGILLALQQHVSDETLRG